MRKFTPHFLNDDNFEKRPMEVHIFEICCACEFFLVDYCEKYKIPIPTKIQKLHSNAKKLKAGEEKFEQLDQVRLALIPIVYCHFVSLYRVKMIKPYKAITPLGQDYKDPLKNFYTKKPIVKAPEPKLYKRLKQILPKNLDILVDNQGKIEVSLWFPPTKKRVDTLDYYLETKRFKKLRDKLAPDRKKNYIDWTVEPFVFIDSEIAHDIAIKLFLENHYKK